MSQGKIIIGLIGMPKAGKGETVQILQDYGFVHQGLSTILGDTLREHNRAKGNTVRISREKLTQFGRELREQKGADIVARMAYERVVDSPRYRHVIDGIRHPDEVLFLSGLGVHMWIICADPSPQRDYEIRLKRFLGSPHQRGEDFEDAALFQQTNDREWDSGEERGVRVGAAIQMALAQQNVRTIVNGSEVGMLQRTVHEELTKLGIITTPEGNPTYASRR